MLLASAATAAAIALAGCEGEEAALTRSSLRAKQPLSPKIVAEIEHKDMQKQSPILIRLFKEEAEVEVWKQTREGRYALLKTYPICRWSGELGPKIKEGDRQAPEGFYAITPGQMNPLSNYYLAFNMGYPNAFDRAHGRTGSQLMVHGDCSSRGCYAMTDEQIGEIYALAREAFFGGQQAFQVQAYPFRMTPKNMARHRTNPHMAFWKMLKRGYDHFEVTHLEPKVNVCEKRYVFDAEAPSGSSSPLSFNPAGACPTYEVPADIIAAVREKEQRDENRTAELAGITPVAPIKTGSDGGMNQVYLAALSTNGPDLGAGTPGQAFAATAYGTVPSHVNPPKAATPVYASRQAVTESAKVALASAESRPAGETTGSTGGFFGFVARAIGTTETAEEEPKRKTLAGRPRHTNVASGPASQRPAATPAATQVASAPRPTTAAAAPARPVLRGTAPETAIARSKPAARPTTPSATASMSSPSTMMSLAGPVIRGAQPALRTGSFENRWSALR